MKNLRNLFVLLIRQPLKYTSVGLFGEHHTLTHRCVVGVGVMVVGVNIAHVSEVVTITFIKMSLDGVGFLIHGIGAVPFVDLLHNISNSFTGKTDEPTNNDHEETN